MCTDIRDNKFLLLFPATLVDFAMPWTKLNHRTSSLYDRLLHFSVINLLISKAFSPCKINLYRYDFLNGFKAYNRIINLNFAKLHDINDNNCVCRNRFFSFTTFFQKYAYIGFSLQYVRTEANLPDTNSNLTLTRENRRR